MDFAIITLIFILILTCIVGYFIANKYLYQGFENTNKTPLIMFLTVLVSSVGILAMMVSYKPPLTPSNLGPRDHPGRVQNLQTQDVDRNNRDAELLDAVHSAVAAHFQDNQDPLLPDPEPLHLRLEPCIHLLHADSLPPAKRGLYLRRR